MTPTESRAASSHGAAKRQMSSGSSSWPGPYTPRRDEFAPARSSRRGAGTGGSAPLLSLRQAAQRRAAVRRRNKSRLAVYPGQGRIPSTGRACGGQIAVPGGGPTMRGGPAGLDSARGDPDPVLASAAAHEFSDQGLNCAQTADRQIRAAQFHVGGHCLHPACPLRRSIRNKPPARFVCDIRKYALT